MNHTISYNELRDAFKGIPHYKIARIQKVVASRCPYHIRPEEEYPQEGWHPELTFEEEKAAALLLLFVHQRGSESK